MTITPAQWETVNAPEAIYCGGPLDGSRIRFRRKDDPHVLEGTVSCHWHYDGCIFDVEMTDECGTTIKLSLHPQFGDEIEPI